MNDPEVQRLDHGNELLSRADPGYADSPLRDNPLYTVAAVRHCLADVTASAGAPAFDLWVGYLVLDAWVANTDRHHQNWGVLVDTRTDVSLLAPSFDHGSSLGFSLRPDRLQALLSEPGRSNDGAPGAATRISPASPSLLDVAAEALHVAGNDYEERVVGADRGGERDRLDVHR